MTRVRGRAGVLFCMHRKDFHTWWTQLSLQSSPTKSLYPWVCAHWPHCPTTPRLYFIPLFLFVKRSNCAYSMCTQKNQQKSGSGSKVLPTPWSKLVFEDGLFGACATSSHSRWKNHLMEKSNWVRYTGKQTPQDLWRLRWVLGLGSWMVCNEQNLL